MKGLKFVLSSVAVSVAVCAVGIGVYDVTVRQPRTPRLAMIDLARLYASADYSFKGRALEGAGTPATAASSAAGQHLRDPGDFGPALEAVLKGLSGECRCAIVAMATIVGADSTVPDFTAEAARRMGLTLRPGSVQ